MSQQGAGLLDVIAAAPDPHPSSLTSLLLRCCQGRERMRKRDRTRTDNRRLDDGRPLQSTSSVLVTHVSSLGEGEVEVEVEVEV